MNNHKHSHAWRALALASTTLCLLAAALSHAAVREIYACSYVNGADRDDLMKARDALVRQSETIGLGGMTSFLWTPNKVQNFERDFLWFNNFEDLNAYAKAADAYATTDAGRSVAARFDEIVECSSSLAEIEQVFDGGTDFGGPGPIVVESFGCYLHEGMDAVAARDLVTHYKRVLEQSNGYATHLFYAVTPMLGSRDSFDRVYFGVHENLQTWAARTTAMQTSEAGAMFARHAEQVVDCSSALWWGERIVPVPE